MRKAAGIILITSGVLLACEMTHVVATINAYRNSPLMIFIKMPSFVFLLGLVVAAVFLITGGILCVRRKYWRVCLASASFAVFSVVFNIAYFSDLFPFSLGWPWRDYIYMRWPIWFMLAAAVIATIFIAVRRKEWQAISDSVDGKVSSDDYQEEELE